MREIEDKIASWRQSLTASGAIDNTCARELESHLRECIEREIEGGAAAGDAFASASAQIGGGAELAREFAKVYPEFSWTHRLLLMVAGYGAVALALSLSRMVSSIAGAFTVWQFPGAAFRLPKPHHIGPETVQAFYPWLPPEGVTVERVHASLLAGHAAQLLSFLLLGAIGLWVIKRNPSNLLRGLANRKSLAFLALGLCGLTLLASHASLWQGFEIRWHHFRLNDVLGQAGIGEHEHNVASNQLWLIAAVIRWVITGVLAFAALRLLRRGDRALSPVRWSVFGYFAIAGIAGLFGVVGVLFGAASGLVASLFGSDALEAMLNLPGLDLICHSFGSVASVLSVTAQLVLLSVLSIRIYREVGGRRSKLGDRVRNWVEKRCYFALALWLALLIWPVVMIVTLTFRYIPEPVANAITYAYVHPVASRGVLVALVFLAVALLAGRRGQRGSAPAAVA